MSSNNEVSQSGKPELEINLPNGIKLALYNANLANSLVTNIDKVNWTSLTESLDASLKVEQSTVVPSPNLPPPISVAAPVLPANSVPTAMNRHEDLGSYITALVQDVESNVLKGQAQILARIKEQIVAEDRLFSEAADYFTTTEHYKGLHKTRKGVYTFLRKSFLDIVGDKHLSEIRYKDILHYTDTLKHIPPNAKKKPEFAGKDYYAIAKEAKADNLKPIKTSTQFKYIKALKKLFHQFMIRFEMNRDLTSCIVSSDYTREEGQSRQPFTDDELRAIFDHDFMKKLDVPWKFWAILLAFFSGMRVNEIGQIDVEDICEIPSGVDANGNTITITCVSLNRKNGKKLKNRNSKRYLPLHSKVIELGFLDYVIQVKSLGFKHLFPDLQSNVERPGSKISDWFNTTHLKSWCEIDDTQKKFHSFRNHFWTYGELTPTVPESAMRKLTGLGRGRTVERVHYIKEADVPGCKKALEEIVFPMVDFMPYDPSQFASYFTEQLTYAKPSAFVPPPGAKRRGRPPKASTSVTNVIT